MDDTLRSHKDYLQKLDDVKADKADLEALKKFMMTALNNNSGDVNMEGLDQLQDLIKRLGKVETAIQNLVTKEQKIVIDNDLKEIWKIVNYIRNDKIPKMDIVFETHAEDIEKLKQEIRRLDLNKMDKLKFDELMNLIRELQKKVKELSNSGPGKDYDKDIKDLKDAQDNIINNLTAFTDATNTSIYLVKEDIKNYATKTDLQDQKNWTQEENDKMREDMQEKLDLKADKEWVEKMLRGLRRDKTPSKGIDADDAMFSRKPLLSSLCASCDSDLKALKGVKAD